MIKANLLKQPNIDIALFGLGKNKGITSNMDYKIFVDHKNHPAYDQMLNVANKLVHLSPEHKKFLRQIKIAIEINMPRYWWSEFDTYKIGTTTQSESTMHTILKQELTVDNFNVEYHEDMTLVGYFIDFVERMKMLDVSDTDKIIRIKKVLPESFLQCRVVTMNYEVFANIYKQRINHRLPEWKFFCTELLKQLPYQNWITQLNK